MKVIMTENAYRISCELTVTVHDADLQRNTKPEEYFKYLLQYCLMTGSKVNSKYFEVTRVTRVDRLECSLFSSALALYR